MVIMENINANEYYCIICGNTADVFWPTKIPELTQPYCNRCLAIEEERIKKINSDIEKIKKK